MSAFCPLCWSYFYPRSPRGERRSNLDSSSICIIISIHAPREGSDRIIREMRQATGISIHAPREGSDSRGPSLTSPLEVFLSTLPARGATVSRTDGRRSYRYFYPRSPRGERPDDLRPTGGPNHKFLSTLPARGATGRATGDRGPA